MCGCSNMVRVKQPRAKKENKKIPTPPLGDSDGSGEDWVPNTKKTRLPRSDSDKSSRAELANDQENGLLGKRNRQVVKPFEPSKRRVAQGKKKKPHATKQKTKSKKTGKKKDSEESDEEDWLKKGFEVIQEVLAEFSKDDKTYYLLRFKGYGHEYNEIYSKVKALWNDTQSNGGGVVFKEWIRRRDSPDYVVSNEADVCAGEYASSRHGKFIPGAYVIGSKGERIGELGTKKPWPLKSIVSVVGSSQKNEKTTTTSRGKKVSKSFTPLQSKFVGVVIPSPQRLSTITTQPLDFDSLAKLSAKGDANSLSFESQDFDCDMTLAKSLSPELVKKKTKTKPKKTLRETGENASDTKKEKGKKASDTKKEKGEKASDTNSNTIVSLGDEILIQVYKKVYEMHTVGGLPSMDMGIVASGNFTTRTVMLQNIAQYVCNKYGVFEAVAIHKYYHSALRKSQNLRMLFVKLIEHTVLSKGGIMWLEGVEPENMALRLLDDGFIVADFVRESFQIIDFERPITHRHVQMILLHIAMRIIWLRDNKTGIARKTEVGVLNKIMSFESLGPQGSQGRLVGGLVHKILGEKQDKIMKVIGEMLEEWEGSGQLVSLCTENTSGDMQSETSTTEDSGVSGSRFPSPVRKREKKALSPGSKREKQALTREQTTPTHPRPEPLVSFS